MHLPSRLPLKVIPFCKQFVSIKTLYLFILPCLSPIKIVSTKSSKSLSWLSRNIFLDWSQLSRPPSLPFYYYCEASNCKYLQSVSLFLSFSFSLLFFLYLSLSLFLSYSFPISLFLCLSLSLSLSLSFSLSRSLSLSFFFLIWLQPITRQ